jgi:hypothetical protein
VSKISLTPVLYILYWFLKVYLPELTIKCWNIWYISSSTTIKKKKEKDNDLDEEITDFVRSLLKGTGRYKGKSPLK